MKVLFTVCSLCLLLILGQFANAQNQGTAPATPTLTPEQMASEYARWTRVRDDWANFARYRDANQKLGPPKAGENRVVFMGNSITDAWIRVDAEFFQGKPYLDRGIRDRQLLKCLCVLKLMWLISNPRSS